MRAFEDQKYAKLQHLKLNKLNDRSDDLNFIVQHEFLGLIKSMVVKTEKRKTHTTKKQEANARKQLYNRVRRPGDGPDSEVGIQQIANYIKRNIQSTWNVSADKTTV